MTTIKPINLKTHEVEAVLRGEKVQHRVVVKPQPHRDAEGALFWGTMYYGAHDESGINFSKGMLTEKCPFGEVGTLLWVREKVFSLVSLSVQDICYATNCPCGFSDVEHAKQKRGWTPSRRIPKEVSRLTLEITNIRVERLQDICEREAEEEGFYDPNSMPLTPADVDGEGIVNDILDQKNEKKYFYKKCKKYYGKQWEVNPWVWVIYFKTHKKNVEEVVNG